MQTQQLHVESISTVANDVYKIILTCSEPLQYQAGQYCMIVMGEGDCRPFSIASSPSESNKIELHIGAVPANAYAWDVLSVMRETGLTTAQIAHGDAFLQPTSQPIVLIAGGTGYSYAKSIIHECVAQQLTQDIHLYWGAKSLEQIYEADELSALASQHANIHFHPVLEHGAKDWQGKTGLVHQAVLTDIADEIADYQIYIAGPFAMAKVARDDFAAAGLPSDALFGDAYAFLD
jgi:aquacobalamin reductase/NAD(P)H-flavin reductase